MRLRVHGVLLALLLTACGPSRCGSKEAADAGVASVEKLAPVELRTALLTIYPEFIGTTLVTGEATLTRQVLWPQPRNASLEQSLAPPLSAMGFHSTDAGGAFATRPPFLFFAKESGDEVLLSLTLPVGAQEAANLLHSPSPISSEHMGSLLPALPGATLRSERFKLELEYLAAERRVDFLLRQLVGLLLNGGWQGGPLPAGWHEMAADGGKTALPEEFELALTGPQDGARIELRRKSLRVKVSFEKTTAQSR